MENVQIKENERIDDLQIKDYRIIQKTDGFCFGIDAVLLSDYARVKKKSKGIDLCSGTGIIPILMEGKYPLVCQDGRAFCEDEWSGRKSAYCTGGCSQYKDRLSEGEF